MISWDLQQMAQAAEAAGLDSSGFTDRTAIASTELEAFRKELLRNCPSDYFRGYLAGGLRHWSRRWEYPFVLAQIARYALHHRVRFLFDDACGVNAVAYLLARAGCDVVGTDLDDAPSAEGDLPSAAWTHRDAEGLPGSLSFQVADSQDLPFDDDHFDVGYSISSLEHMSDPVVAMAELIRVVRPGGLVVFTMDVACCEGAIGTEFNLHRGNFSMFQELVSRSCVPFAPLRFPLPGDELGWRRDGRTSSGLRRGLGRVQRAFRGTPEAPDFFIYGGSFQKRGEEPG